MTSLETDIDTQFFSKCCSLSNVERVVFYDLSSILVCDRHRGLVLTTAYAFVGFHLTAAGANRRLARCITTRGIATANVKRSRSHNRSRCRKRRDCYSRCADYDSLITHQLSVCRSRPPDQQTGRCRTKKIVAAPPEPRVHTV